MTGVDILEQRLVNHRLLKPTGDERAPETPNQLIGWLGAVQSQDYPGAKWSLGMRIPGLPEAQVEAAFQRGEILRTHVLRPTWHFVTPQDIRWLLELTGPRVNAQSAFRYRQLELDEDQFQRANTVIAQTLQGGHTCTRAELGASLETAGVPVEGQRLPYILMRAELDELICSGPRRGTQHTYALLEERVPPAPRLSREEALAELARRYFTSHGPATRADFTWWCGLAAVDVKQAIALAGASLEAIELNGDTYYHAVGLPAAAGQGDAVHLLPTYDEFLVGYQDFGRRRNGGLEALPPGGFDPRIITGGRVTGSWRRTFKKDRVVVEIIPFFPLTANGRQAVEAAVQRLGEYLELPCQVTIGKL